MKNINVRRIISLGLAISGLFGVVTLAGASQARSDFYYQYYFYSDSSHTNLVGQARQYCLNNNIIITPLVTGVWTDYYTMEAIGRCPGLGDW